jgi:hypothetical protein
LQSQQKTDAIVSSVNSHFGAAFRIRTEDLLITKGEAGCGCVAYRSISGLFFRGMWVLYAVCVSLRFKAFQQFGDNWREFGEKNFSP